VIFWFLKKIGFWGFLGPPSYGIGATIRIDGEMLCLPYAGFFYDTLPAKAFISNIYGGVFLYRHGPVISTVMLEKDELVTPTLPRDKN
jgi:hypothetical protein